MFLPPELPRASSRSAALEVFESAEVKAKARGGGACRQTDRSQRSGCQSHVTVGRGNAAGSVKTPRSAAQAVLRSTGGPEDCG
ncbi:hypothetical protein EYF80_065965 [Liparis tanakae]|uniref:Uncharacterized protein n=1 Tax=Liparis tanakae TaxID=230148 RepID=A0A4Z2E5I8_9TELE|nr:hypothetical protein EYF80_065965 [Liparis tanakae]